MPHAPAATGSLAAAAARADAVKRQWRAGGHPDAVGTLRDHPELLRRQSLVVDLAYEEYCLREEAGAAPDPAAFAARFPAFRTAVREVLQAHAWLADQHGLLPDEPTWPRPGDGLAGYEVVGEIARGGFARVYLAADPEVGRHVVLKVAPGGGTEAREMGRVRHPHVIDVYWAGRVGELFVICMPFVAVATLQDVCDAGAADAAAVLAAVARAEAAYADFLPPPTGTGGAGPAAVAARVADALAALHRAGIVHADLKPSNVLLAAGGHPYLIDFNLAVGGGADRLRCGGTLPYMAPELLAGLTGGNPAKATTRSDVFAFGALLYQILTGKVPFEPVASPDPRAVAADLLARQRSGPPPVAPGPLGKLAARCLAADPAARPADAGELVRALRPTRRPVRPWAAVAAVAAVGLSAWTLADRADPTPGPSRVEPDLPADPFDRGRHFLKQNDVPLAIEWFSQAYKVRKDGRTAAHLAYCYALRGQSGAAVDMATEAITLGSDTPAVRNNRAYSLVQQSRLRNTNEAVAELTAALTREPALRAARYNLATTLFWKNLDQKTLRLRDLECVRHMDDVMRDGPTTAQLNYEAAQIYGVADRQQNRAPDRALERVREAVRQGRDQAQLRNDPVLKGALGNVVEFEQALAAPPALPALPAPNVNLALVDPGPGG